MTLFLYAIPNKAIPIPILIPLLSHQPVPIPNPIPPKSIPIPTPVLLYCPIQIPIPKPE